MAPDGSAGAGTGARTRLARLATAAARAADLLPGPERGLRDQDRAGLERQTRRSRVPAEELDEFNAHIVGHIQVVHEFHDPCGCGRRWRHRAVPGVITASQASWIAPFTGLTPIDADSRLVAAAGRPVPGNMNDCATWQRSGANAAAGRGVVITDGGSRPPNQHPGDRSKSVRDRPQRPSIALVQRSRSRPALEYAPLKLPRRVAASPSHWTRV